MSGADALKVTDHARVADQMCVALARLLRDGERVFFGLASPLPMVAVLLARATHAPGLVPFTIPGGTGGSFEELSPSTVSPQLAAGARAIFTLSELFDMSARGDLDTVFLSGVQIDARGRINMSAIGPYDSPKVRLPGGAGSALLLPTARRAILWRTRHDRRTFVERLDFVTAAGNVDAVVTPLCVFRRRPHNQPEAALRVESIHPGVTPDQLVQQTGFALPGLDAAPVTPPPSMAELAALERLDPQRVRAAEF